MKLYRFYNPETKEFASPVISNKHFETIKCPLGFQIFSITKITL